MKLGTVAVFGLGYVLGTRAGRERYDQLRTVAGAAARRIEGPSARQRLESYGTWLEAYARRTGNHANVGGGTS